MWAPAWGFLFWLFLHAFAKSYEDKIMSQEEITQIQIFFNILIRWLPCPSCRVHALSYVHKVPFVFQDGKELANYFHVLHNDVNQRTNKIQLTRKEADEALMTNLENQKASDLTNSFPDVYWLVLTWIAHNFTMNPDKPSEIEQKMMTDFLHSVCYVLPFRDYKCSNGKEAKEVLLETLENNINVTTRELVLETINTMYNSLSLEFGVLHRTMAQTKKMFDNGLDPKQYPLYIRMVEAEQATHKKLIALQKELEQVKPMATETNNADATYWMNVSIALSVILGVVLLLIVFWMVKVWRNNKVTNSSKSSKS